MKKRNKKRSRKKDDGYNALISVLILIVVIEFGFLTAPQAASSAVNELLDISNFLRESTTGLVLTLQPGIDAIESINTFYQMATTEMMQLLDMSDDFISLTQLFGGKVAGESIENCSSN